MKEFLLKVLANKRLRAAAVAFAVALAAAVAHALGLQLPGLE